MLNSLLTDAIKSAQLLGYFKTFCEQNIDPIAKMKIRNILAVSPDRENTIRKLFEIEQKIQLDKMESKKMLELIWAFLNKTTFRTPISEKTKENLLVKQKFKCAICGCQIDKKAHADHIVPFKYVGDCLNYNWQMLCAHCNKTKNASLDYQIKYLLKLS